MSTYRGLERYLEEFPHLADALDKATSTSLLSEHFAHEYPSALVKIDECLIDRIYLKPGSSCRIHYRLNGTTKDGAFQQWIQGTMRSGRRLDASREPVSDAPAFGRPESVCPELGMKLLAFPFDDALPMVGRLLNPEYVLRSARARASALGLDRSEIAAVVVQPVRYRRGKHCLLRYEIRNAEGGTLRTIYCKAYAGSRLSGYVNRVLLAVWGSPARRRGEIGLPEPVAHVESVHALWQAEWPGVRIGASEDLLNSDDRAAMEQLDDVGTLLAGLHSVEAPGMHLNHERSPNELLGDVREDADGILRFHPELAERMDSLIEQFEHATPTESGSSQVMLHGTFKISQILRGPDGRLGIIDFDGASRGDPHYDISEFVASYLHRTLTHRYPGNAVRSGIERLLDSYGRTAKRYVNRAQIRHYTAAFLLAKVHASLKTIEWTDVGPVLEGLTLVEQTLQLMRWM